MFPRGTGAARQSRAGARWVIGDRRPIERAPDGTEAYYRSGGRLIAARIDWTAGVRVRSRRVVVEPFPISIFDNYDVHPDSRTMVIVRPAGGEVTIVLNWFTELRRRLRNP
jgi:hypothetical protein